jgi:hypothetical protein
MYVPDTVLSDNPAEAIPAEPATPFTVNSYSLVDARYRNTTVSHKFCTITPVALQVTIVDAPFTRSLYKSAEDANLARSMILSYDPGVPVKRTTATIVRPPLVAIFKVRDPASRY